MKGIILVSIVWLACTACVRETVQPAGYTDRYTAGKPVVAVDSVTGVTSGGALVWARIISTGGKDLKKLILCLSDTADCPDTLHKVLLMDETAKKEGDTLLISLENRLHYNTLYQGRLYIENIDSAAYSETFGFHTLKNRGILTPELLAPEPDLNNIRVGVRCVYDEGDEPDLDSLRWGVVFADHPNPGFDDWHYAEYEESVRDYVFYAWIGMYKLKPDTDYYYRIYLTNKYGTVWTRESVFRIPPRKSPLIGDFQITDIRKNEADFYFYLENAGGYEEYCYGVLYGESADLNRYGSSVSAGTEIKNSAGWHFLTCTALNAGTTYYARCFAENPQGKSYGPVWRFSTLPEDGVRSSCWEKVQALNYGVLVGNLLQMTCNNRLYLLVMEYDREEGAAMFEYDYRHTGRLHRTAPFPGKCRQTCPAACLDGKIYIGPGLASGKEHPADIWCFDPLTDCWEKQLDFPQKYKGYSFIGFVAEEKWFLVSARPIGNRRVFLCYDPAENYLEELPDAPWGEGCDATCAFGAGDRLFLLLNRGSGFSARQIDFWEYLPGEKRWQYYAAFDGYWGDPPIVFRIDGRIYIGGGNWPTDIYPGMMEFDVKKGTLTRKHNLPDFCWNNCRTVLDGDVIVLFTGDSWKYNPELDVPLGEITGE